jgi:hypothetical protein
VAICDTTSAVGFILVITLIDGKILLMSININKKPKIINTIPVFLDFFSGGISN